jgi:hypothetical protein
MGLQTLPFGVGEIGWVAPFHAQERTSSTYVTRFSKQLLEGVFYEILQKFTADSSPLARIVTQGGGVSLHGTPTRRGSFLTPSAEDPTPLERVMNWCENPVE